MKDIRLTCLTIHFGCVEGDGHFAVSEPCQVDLILPSSLYESTLYAFQPHLGHSRVGVGVGLGGYIGELG